jgi:uncharacterized membrane protein YfcA
MLGIFLYILTGAVAGFMAGLFGVGGGIIIVPMLAYLFPSMKVSSAIVMHLAAGTSLAAITFILLIAIIKQLKDKLIIWSVLRELAPGIVLGAIAGSCITSYLPVHTLKILFGLFMWMVAVHMLWPDQQHDHPPATRVMKMAAGWLIGGMSGLLGIGGGVFAVPILLRFGLSIRHATVTSLVCAFLPSVIGACCFILLGWHKNGLPTGSSGYVYWPAAISIALASIIFVSYGARLAQRLSSVMLKRIFAGYLVLTGAALFIG